MTGSEKAESDAADSEKADNDKKIVTVADAPDRARYVATIDGVEVGVLKYRRGDGVIDLRHTVVHEGFEGHGIGSALIRFALEDARASGIGAIPSCPFIPPFLEKHPDYRDVIGVR